jgi:hypothetical protein
MRGRGGWPGALDFGTLRDLERVAVQFTSDLRRLATQSSAAGENVIGDLRTILEDALERIKSEIFGPGHEEERHGADAPASGTPASGTPASGTSASATPASATPASGAKASDAAAGGAKEGPAGGTDDSAP